MRAEADCPRCAGGAGSELQEIRRTPRPGLRLRAGEALDREPVVRDADQTRGAAGPQGRLEFGRLHVAAERQWDQSLPEQCQEQCRPGLTVSNLDADNRSGVETGKLCAKLLRLGFDVPERT